jgi:hypothetical protein
MHTVPEVNLLILWTENTINLQVPIILRWLGNCCRNLKLKWMKIKEKKMEKWHCSYCMELA